jgi:hypothetical protein
MDHKHDKPAGYRVSARPQVPKKRRKPLSRYTVGGLSIIAVMAVFMAIVAYITEQPLGALNVTQAVLTGVIFYSKSREFDE